MENELLQKVKDEVAQANHFADWFQIDMTDMEQCQRDEIKAMMLDDVAIKFAEAYAAKLVQEKDGEQCFTKEEVLPILLAWMNDEFNSEFVTDHLNAKASQYATDRAKKVLDVIDIKMNNAYASRDFYIRTGDKEAINKYTYRIELLEELKETLTNPKNLEL